MESVNVLHFLLLLLEKVLAVVINLVIRSDLNGKVELKYSFPQALVILHKSTCSFEVSFRLVREQIEALGWVLPLRGPLVDVKYPGTEKPWVGHQYIWSLAVFELTGGVLARLGLDIARFDGCMAILGAFLFPNLANVLAFPVSSFWVQLDIFLIVPDFVVWDDSLTHSKVDLLRLLVGLFVLLLLSCHSIKRLLYLI